MTKYGVRLFAAAVVLLAAAPASAGAVEPSGDPPAAMYHPDNVDVVYLTLPPASITALDAEPNEYVEGTFSLAETDGTPAGIGTPSTPLTVGIRLKGQLGSARNLSQKAAFKVKFSWVKGQKFLGLKKLTLNNMVQDPSSLHEALSYRAFRAAGVPASRTGYAYVYVNGVDYGLHLNVENVDDVATEKRIGDFEHVYEGSYGSDVETGPGPSAAEVTEAAEGFEVDEGDEDDLGDLEALIVAVDSSVAGDWSRRVEAFADLKEMTRMWAVEKYVGNWDGYSGQESGFQPNNYYLQSDGQGWFRMLPWGVDQTWIDHLGFDGDAGVLFDRCLADSGCAEMYRRSLREARSAIVAADLEQMATDLGAVLQPWVAEEQANSRHEYSLEQFEDWVVGTAAFAATRPAEASAWLAAQPPELPVSQIFLTLPQSPVVADGVSAVTATVTAVNVSGDAVPGESVTLSSSDPEQRFGPVVDNDDGTYSVRVVASSVAGLKSLSASMGALTAPAYLLQVAGPAARVAVSAQPDPIPADGSATATVIAKVTDAMGNPILSHQLSFSSTDAGQRLGPVRDRGDGIYAVEVAASTRVGAATITAVDTSVDPALSGTAVLRQVAPVSSGADTDGASATPASIPGAVALLARPRHRTHDRRPTFRFAAQPGARFRCKLDDRPYRACASPVTLPKLALGLHVFRIRAISATGPGPISSFTFVVKPRP